MLGVKINNSFGLYHCKQNGYICFIMNTPYKKVLDEQGFVSNPITKNQPFVSFGKNRKQRREILQKNPFKGNKKGISLSVSGQIKYSRTIQEIKCKDGSIKRVYHQN